MQRSPSLLLLIPLLSASLALAPAAQGGRDRGGAGGRYGGPGDTVPHPSGPETPPRGPIGGRPGGPENPDPPEAPGGPERPDLPGRPGFPPPGMPPDVPPDEPATPGARPPRADPTAWQVWWHYNRWSHLDVGRARGLSAVTDGDGFFLGRGERREPPTPLRASDEQVRDLVAPALLSVLHEGGRAQLEVFALHALAKLSRSDVPGAEWSFEEAVRRGLRDGSGLVAEQATLALGVRGRATALAPLFSILADDRAGRLLVARGRVGHRLRAFAAYALALVAEANPDPALRERIFEELAPLLAGERPEVQAAAVFAIGFTATAALAPPPAADPAVPPASRDAERIHAVLRFFGDGGASPLARSQAPGALARLLGQDAPEPLRREVAQALLEAIGARSTLPTELKNGAVIALGSIGRAGGGELDRGIRGRLERVATGAGADRLTRHLALISLAQVSARPARGDDPLVALEPTRRFLLGHLARSRGQTLAWTALALGILEEGALARGGMPSAEVAAALRDRLATGRSGDVVGALALALGMLRDVESQDLLLERMEDSGSGLVRGYAALALGMTGAGAAREPMQAQLATAAHRPGSLQRVAIGLSLLGDDETGPILSGMLLEASQPEIQASIASAMGWVRDSRPLPGLAERLLDPGEDGLSRAWTAVALGRICDRRDLPWNARLSIGANYDVALATLIDPEGQGGLLDVP